MEKKLFMRIPLVNAYTIYGSMFAITNDNILTWVYNHMTQIIYVHSWKIITHGIHYPFLRSCPFIDTFNMPQSLLLKKWSSSVIDIIMDAINSDFYVLLNVDQYDIKAADGYKRKHFFHELFIYGYDSDRQVFYAADNLQAGKYISMEFPFSEIEKAYHNLRSKYGYETDINFLKPNNSAGLPINLQQIANGIDGYLHSKPTTDYDESCDYGVKAVLGIYQSLGGFAGTKNFVDIRPFHVLYEHKMLMRMRLEYLIAHMGFHECDALLEKYTALENNYFHLRNVMVKYNFTKNEAVIESAKKKFLDYMSAEEKMLTSFHSILKARDIASGEW